MKITSILKLLILFAIFYYLITFIQANQEASTVRFPWIGEHLVVGGPGWAVIGACVAVGFLASALWMLVQTIVSFFSPSGKLARSMKKIEEKYYYGIEALSKGDQQAASVFFEEILGMDPDNIRTLVKYGEVLRGMGKGQRAITLHQQALNLSQNNVKVLHELCQDYLSTGEVDKARGMLEKIIDISPKGNIAIHRQLRDLLITRKAWDDALRVQRNIITMISSSVEREAESELLSGIEYEYAMDYLSAQQIQKAQEVLEKIITRDKKFIPAHLRLGECLLMKSREDEAVLAWKRGYDTTASPVLLSRLEEYYLSAEQPDKAIETYNQVIKEQDDNLMPRLLLGKLYYHLEMIDQAIEIFEEIDSDFEYAPLMFYYMGKIQSRKGDNKGAVETFSTILRSSGILEEEFKCGNCGKTYEQYVPHCDNCGTWNHVTLNVRTGASLEEMRVASRPIYV